jgi:hypothetical protein
MGCEIWEGVEMYNTGDMLNLTRRAIAQRVANDYQPPCKNHNEDNDDSGTRRKS